MIPATFNFSQDVIDGFAGDDRAGLIFVDAHGYRRDYTFAEISLQSQRYAAALRTLGVVQGERVALCDSNNAKCLFILLALQRLGAVAIPCPEELTHEEIVERVDRTSATAVITNRKRRPLVERIKVHLSSSMRYLLVSESREGWARVDTLAEVATPLPGITTQSSDPALIFGDDLFDHGAIHQTHAIADLTLETDRTDRAWSTFSFGTERWLSFVQAPWWNGASTVIHESDFDPLERFELLHELEVTILCQPAQQYRSQLDLTDVKQFRLPRLHRCLATEDAPDSQLQERWQQAFGLPLVDAIAYVGNRLP